MSNDADFRPDETGSDAPSSGPILTLEPLVDAVREGVEAAGWTLSGMQKTTSYHFEGRWEGDSTRSAYLFFHRAEDGPSVDVFLDETSRGLQGNLALVVAGARLGGLGGTAELLASLGALTGDSLASELHAPLTLRFRHGGPEADPRDAPSECRFKVSIPGTAITVGPAGVRTVSAAAMEGFERILSSPALDRFVEGV